MAPPTVRSGSNAPEPDSLQMWSESERHICPPDKDLTGREWVWLSLLTSPVADETVCVIVCLWKGNIDKSLLSKKCPDNSNSFSVKKSDFHG